MSNWTLWCLLAAPIVSLGCGGSKDTDTGPDTSTTDTSTTDTSTTDTSTTGDQVRYNWFNPRGSDVPDAWAEGAFESSWPEVYGQTDAVSFYINGVGEDARGNMTLAFEFLTEHSMAIAVEGGGTLNSEGCDALTGENSAATELAKIQTIYDAGGTLSYLSMDGPLSRTLATGRADNCGFDLDTAVTELVDYVAAIRLARPEIKIGWAVNFPNWSYDGISSYQCATKDHGDLEVAIESVLTALAAAGESIDYFMADNPYDYATGQKDSNCHDNPAGIDWMGRIVALENQVVAAGLPFALIYNSATGGSTSNQMFHDDTVAFVADYQAAGGNPAIRHVESWYTYPDTLLPETEDYTLTNTVLDSYRAMTSRWD